MKIESYRSLYPTHPIGHAVQPSVRILTETAEMV